ncbi:hypothetical protein Tco_1466337 [Tanacetum coccineum]
MSQPVSTTVQAPLPTSTAIVTTITTTTSLSPPPPQPQQSTTDPILIRRIGELEQHMADLIQRNLALEERVDKHGSRLYKLENLNIPHRVQKAVDQEILHQRMFEDNSYEAYEVHANLFDALEKSLERDHSDQLLSDLDEARMKKRKRRTSGASGSTQFPPPPPPPPTGASGSAPQQDSKAPSLSMAMASILESMAWTTSDIRYESTGVSADQDSSPTESLMHDDSTPDEQVQSSDDEDTRNDQKPEADTRKDWWKPLPEEERPATPEPAWTILPSNVSDVENNWASALASSYEPLTENSLLVNWANPKGDQVRINVNRPLPLGGPPGHVTIQTEFFFNKDLEYLRYGNKGSCPALLISKMKAASYADFGLEFLVPESMWIDDVHESPSRRKDVRTNMWILSVVRIKAYSRYGYDYLSEIVLRRADHQEHKIAEKDFKNLYPSDFEDLNLLLLQGHLDHLSGSDKRMLSTAVKLWTRNLVIRQRVEDFQLGIESYQTQLNLTKPGWDATGY